ncbi:ABC transporter ATP-binding protein [Ornithinimicrobium panacihumi]|uniref:ABC transporter ATP-binding protein n=1 Tax=Ornithinimicrobium panacihumi TaxID=2008449 RepID=UPI003F8BAF8F
MRLTATGLSFAYKNSSVALDDISFEVSGDCVGLLGPNGAGKTTLLSLLTGAFSVQSGSLSPSAESARVGYVPQDLRIDPTLTTEQFVAYCAWLKELPVRQWDGQISRVLDLLDIGDYRRTRVGALSGGLRRRVALAQAFLGEPTLVVLDEPSNALDPAQRHDLLGLLRSLKGEVGIVLSSHLVEDVVATADDIIILNRGRLAWAGALRTVAQPPHAAAELEQFFLSVTG